MMGFIAAVTHCSYKSNPRTLRGVETNPCCWGAERRAVIDAGWAVGWRDGAHEAVDVGYVLKAAVDSGLHEGRVAGDAAWGQWGWWQGGGGMRGWRVRYAGRSVVVGGRAAPPGTALWGYGPPFTPFESLRTGFAFPQRERTPRPRAALPLWVSALAGMTREGEGGRSPILTFPPEGEGIPRDPAPLGSCIRGNDNGGCEPAGVAGGGGGGPAAAGRALREAPLRWGGGELGWRRGLVVGVRRPATPLWIPAFAGMTTGGQE